MKNKIFLSVITIIFLALCVLALATGINFTGVPVFVILIYIAVKLQKIEDNL